MRKFAIVLMCAALLLPFGAQAAGVNPARNFYLGKTETASGDLLGAGNLVDIAGSVGGDLISAGGNVNVSGNIKGDDLLAGGTIYLGGKTEGSSRVIGGNLEFTGEVAKNVTTAGGNVRFSPDSKVGSNVYAVGGFVILDGTVNGGLKAAGGSVVIGGKIKGDVLIYAGNVMIKNGAEIGGNLTYYSQNQAVIDAGAKIAGKTEYKKIEAAAAKPGNWLRLGATVTVWFLLWKLLSSLIVALVAWKLFARFLQPAVGDYAVSFWKKLLHGLIALVVVPVGSVIVMVTLLGLPLGLVTLALYIVGLYLASILGAVLLGRWLCATFNITDRAGSFPWYAVSLGLFLQVLIGVVPMIGGLFCLVLMLWGLGTLFGMFHSSEQTQSTLL
jgi:cytoskeletal protein CcmA (bactofilin family)